MKSIVESLARAVLLKEVSAPEDWSGSMDMDPEDYTGKKDMMKCRRALRPTRSSSTR